MIEVLLYSLIIGLSLVGMIAFRWQMKNQINHVFRALEIDTKPGMEIIKVRPVETSYAFKESTQRIRK